MYDGGMEPTAARPADPLVLFAGRLIPEKQAPLGVAAIALAAAAGGRPAGRVPRRRPRTGRAGGRDRLQRPRRQRQRPRLRGRRDRGREMRRALCMLLPSRREGYGMVVVEAAARGTPSVVVAGEDNAATELIVPGVNGLIAPDADPQSIADAIVRRPRGGHRAAPEHLRLVRPERRRARPRVLAADRARELRPAERALVAGEREARGALPRERRSPLAARGAQPA